MGAFDTGLIGSRIFSVLYNAAAPFSGLASSDYDLRDTSTRVMSPMPLARDGFVDMAIVVYSTLTRVLGTGLALSASADTVTKTAHGLSNGYTVTLANNTATGVSNATTYYVANATTNTFQLANSTGVVQNITADGTADVTASCSLGINLNTVHTLGSSSLANASGVALFGSGGPQSSMPNGGRWMFSSQASAGLTSGIYRSYAIPELGMPIDAMRLSYNAWETPDAGSVAVRVIKRA